MAHPAGAGETRRVTTARIGRHNLALLAETTHERRGDYRALLFEGTWHSSAALHERAARIAGGLIELGVCPGDRVHVIARNCPEVLLAYQATWPAGAVVVLSIFMLSEGEVEHVLRDSGARVALVEADLLAKVRGAAASAGAEVRIVALGEPSAGHLKGPRCVGACGEARGTKREPLLVCGTKAEPGALRESDDWPLRRS
jgi:acyl-CoA synthetase (AMP-forming)/AMP-acid ligase II